LSDCRLRGAAGGGCRSDCSRGTRLQRLNEQAHKDTKTLACGETHLAGLLSLSCSASGCDGAAVNLISHTDQISKGKGVEETHNRNSVLILLAGGDVIVRFVTSCVNNRDILYQKTLEPGMRESGGGSSAVGYRAGVASCTDKPAPASIYRCCASYIS
jgi:hypothetical protein